MAKILPKNPVDTASKDDEVLPVTPEVGAVSLESEPKKQIPWKAIVPISLAFLTAVLAGAYYYLYYYQKPASAPTENENTAGNLFSIPQPKTSVKPTPTPTPIVLKPDNGTKGTYLISQVKNGGPVVKQVIFDPLDVKKGQSFTVTIIMDAESAADQITGVFESDTTRKNIAFERVTQASGAQTWQSKFTIEDSVLWKYMLTFVAKTGDKSSTVTVAPRS